jgi:dihydroneopterin aldolase
MSGDRRVFVSGLVLPARIGVLDHEHHGPQRIRVGVTFTVADPGGVGPDVLARVVDYGRVAAQVREVVGAGHVRLVETLAERIAEAVLTEPRIRTVEVRVEKLDILGDGAIAGVEIVRGR